MSYTGDQVSVGPDGIGSSAQAPVQAGDLDHAAPDGMTAATGAGTASRATRAGRRYALDDRDGALAWVWPSRRESDELVPDAVDAATEVLAIGLGRERAEDDTVWRLDLRDGWAASGAVWPEQSPWNMSQSGPRQAESRD